MAGQCIDTVECDGTEDYFLDCHTTVPLGNRPTPYTDVAVRCVTGMILTVLVTVIAVSFIASLVCSHCCAVTTTPVKLFVHIFASVAKQCNLVLAILHRK